MSLVPSLRAGDKNTVLLRPEIREFVENVSGETVSDTFNTDLNDDSLSDKFVGVTCGTGGCEYHCFLRHSGENYAYIGNLLLNKDGFEILKTKHNGINDILAYWHLSGSEGELIRFEYDGHNFKRKSTIKGSSELFNLLQPSVCRPELDD